MRGFHKRNSQGGSLLPLRLKSKDSPCFPNCNGILFFIRVTTSSSHKTIRSESTTADRPLPNALIPTCGFSPSRKESPN